MTHIYMVIFCTILKIARLLPRPADPLRLKEKGISREAGARPPRGGARAAGAVPARAAAAGAGEPRAAPAEHAAAAGPAAPGQEVQGR